MTSFYLTFLKLFFSHKCWHCVGICSKHSKIGFSWQAMRLQSSWEEGLITGQKFQCQLKGRLKKSKLISFSKPDVRFSYERLSYVNRRQSAFAVNFAVAAPAWNRFGRLSSAIELCYIFDKYWILVRKFQCGINTRFSEDHLLCFQATSRSLFF